MHGFVHTALRQVFGWGCRHRPLEGRSVVALGMRLLPPRLGSWPPSGAALPHPPLYGFLSNLAPGSVHLMAHHHSRHRVKSAQLWAKM